MQHSYGLDIGINKWAMAILSRRAGGLFAIEGRAIAFGQLLEPCGHEVMVFDVPIGLLPDDQAAVSPRGLTGDRAVDRGARKWCRAPSSVFPPPTISQFFAGIKEHKSPSGADGKRILSAVQPGGFSKQTFELLPAIEDAYRLKNRSPDNIFESHPEVVFSVLNEGVVPFSKLTLPGALIRAKLLTEKLGFDVLEWALVTESETHLSADNWLDALAMAYVASDWTKKSKRFTLCDESGIVQPWIGQREFIIATPTVKHQVVPRKASRVEAIDNLRHWLRNRTPSR